MRFFISLAIASIILLVLNSSTNAKPWFDKNIEDIVHGSVYEAEQTAHGDNNKLTVVFPKSKRDISGILKPVTDGDILGGDNQVEFEKKNVAKSNHGAIYKHNSI